MTKLTAKKVKMTQLWKDEKVIPVTVVKCVSEGELGVAAGDKVKISGYSKGRGFQGGVKRHGFHGGPKTHGQKNRHRAPGSIGSTAPQRVVPGRRMAGHMGTTRVTMRNVQVIDVDAGAKVLFLKGAVPGMKGSEIEISSL